MLAGGLGRLNKGHFSRIEQEQGLRDANISSMVVDQNGSFWFASDHGVFQVQARELEAVAAGREPRILSVTYGRDEGFPSLQGNYGYAPGSLRSRDGRLWFPMRTGLAVVHPDRVQPNRIPPTVVIEHVVADGKTMTLPNGVPWLHEDNALRRGRPQPPEPWLQLPLGYRNLEIDFTALSFTAPESVRFRYRLEGEDEGWIEAGTQRSARYSRLPAGEYRLLVKACNNAGVWSEPGQELSFIVQPFFWQTLWFRVAVLVIVTLSLVFWVRHVRRLHAKIRHLEQAAGANK